MDNTPDLKNGDIIKERYKVEALIASGGMGETYRAYDNKSKVTVVLKVLDFAAVKQWKELDLFYREVETLKNLNHPNIPDYINDFRYDISGKTYFILVQEYIEGNDLEQNMKKGKRFTMEQIMNIFKTLLEILDYIHNLQPSIIHRDINPKNVILDKNGKVFLVDFGAVGKVAKSSAVAGSTFVGTVGYMPPEQVQGKCFPQSDLYAVGFTIIFLLTGRPPMDLFDDMGNIVYHDYVNIPDNLRILLDKLIEHDYDKRVTSAKKALDFLEGKIKAIPVQYSAPSKIKDAHEIFQISETGDNEKIIKILADKKTGKLLIGIGAGIAFLFFILVLIGISDNPSDRNIELMLYYTLIALPFIVATIILGIYNLYSSKMFEINDNGIVSYKIFKNKKTLENEISFDNYVGCEIAKMRGNNRYGTTYRVIVRGNDDKIVIGTKRRFDMHDAELIKSSIEDFVANKFLV